MVFIILLVTTIFVPAFNTEPSGLQIGDEAPGFIARDQDGDQVVLKDILKERKVVLTFYRGAWCRYCMKQMMDYQDSLGMIEAAGVILIAISPEHEQGIRRTVEKSDASFSIVRDEDLQIMLDYKTISQAKVDEYRRLSQETEEDISRKYVPVPALYIINQDGIVEFVSFDSDYKQRLTVKYILEQLE
jgi:peroxiredoxin